mgnify:CR=1 FL=1
MTNVIQQLTELGQSLWYDNIQRRLLVRSPEGDAGELERMIERGEIRGVTSNPSIFLNAIAKTNDYDSALTPLAWYGSHTTTLKLGQSIVQLSARTPAATAMAMNIGGSSSREKLSRTSTG